MPRLLSLTLLSIMLIACTTPYSPAVTSELQQGKRNFDGGYYKSAMRQLLPLACDGNADAEYAVGYMYYYGYGVAQDTEVGTFWVERSAHQNYMPAIKAKEMILDQSEKPRHLGTHQS